MPASGAGTVRARGAGALTARRRLERDFLCRQVKQTLGGLIEALGLTQARLALRLEVSDARISRILNQHANLTLRSIADIGWATGVRFEFVPFPLEDRSETPAAEDPPLAEWLAEALEVYERLRAVAWTPQVTSWISANDGTEAFFALRRSFERELLYRQVVETLGAVVGAVGLNQSRLAHRLSVSDARISRILNRHENLTLRSLADIGWATGARFELVPFPLSDRMGTPAASDPPPPSSLVEGLAVLDRLRAAHREAQARR
jgi:plasmid maintenance system antidote protein VapI